MPMAAPQLDSSSASVAPMKPKNAGTALPTSLLVDISGLFWCLLPLALALWTAAMAARQQRERSASNWVSISGGSRQLAALWFCLSLRQLLQPDRHCHFAT